MASKRSTSSVKTPSGVEIGYEAFSREGADDAPVLIFVHGTLSNHTKAEAFAEAMVAASGYTVCCVDRRGRGLSSDEEAYSLEREFDDIAAVCDSFSKPVVLFGHSFGGAVALGAAKRAKNISQLVLCPRARFDGLVADPRNAKCLPRGEKQFVLSAHESGRRAITRVEGP